MCAYDLQLPAPVNLVTFQRQRTNELAALTADGHISVYGQGEPPEVSSYFSAITLLSLFAPYSLDTCISMAAFSSTSLFPLTLLLIH